MLTHASILVGRTGSLSGPREVLLAPLAEVQLTPLPRISPSRGRSHSYMDRGDGARHKAKGDNVIAVCFGSVLGVDGWMPSVIFRRAPPTTLIMTAVAAWKR